MDYLLQFVIASSIIIFAPFFSFVHKKINEGKLDINYYDYTIYAPIIYGLLNIIGKILQDIFNLSDLIRFLIVALLSYVGLTILLVKYNLYNFNKEEFINHLIDVVFNYLFIWLILINLIEKLILNKRINSFEKKILLFYFICFLLKKIINFHDYRNL